MKKVFIEADIEVILVLNEVNTLNAIGEDDTPSTSVLLPPIDG